MGDLVNLRHLDIRGARLIREMPLGVKKLKCIRTLSNFVVGEGVVSSLKDLKELKFIRGELYTSRLDNATDCHETRDSILCDKKDLEVLVLEWSSSHASRDEEVEKIVLDILQPHTNLKELTINNFCGKKISSWIGDPSFSNMVSLKLDGCESRKTLPSIGLIGSLKNLTIKGMKMLKKIGENGSIGILLKKRSMLKGSLVSNSFPYHDVLNSLKDRLPNRLLSLEKLVITNCEQLVVSFTSFSMLCHLVIERCKSVLCNGPIDSRTLNPLPLLETVVIDKCEELGISLSSLPVLRSLNIRRCSKGMEELTHLWGNEIFLEKPLQGSQSFTSLKELYMAELPNLVLFPDGLLSIPKKVEISRCHAITSLHGGLKHNNARVEHLPDLPSSLLELWVSDCPLLKQRCKRDKGQEWPKITHIPCVEIDNKFIYDPEEEE
ncbi:putative disease resistance protein RGA3 [Pistacia vera]|uniref:putative disease resistance protein RGA3 n=1 Tax=Pistacia vera TaxID=55513 RepID=UPI001262C32F|nr:putative disease resistance protein RGA3 [Pistacia vera]